jgi:hypothetical protein
MEQKHEAFQILDTGRTVQKWQMTTICAVFILVTGRGKEVKLKGLP